MLTQTPNTPDMYLKSYKAYCISKQKAVPLNEQNFDNLYLSSSYYENYKETGRLSVISALGVWQHQAFKFLCFNIKCGYSLHNEGGRKRMWPKIQVAVRVGLWSTMLSKGKGYYPVFYMNFVMGKGTGMKSVTRIRKIMNKRTNL